MDRIKAVIIENDPEAARQLRAVIQQKTEWAVEHLAHENCELVEQACPDVVAFDLTIQATQTLKDQVLGDRPKLIAMATDVLEAKRAFEFNAVDFLPKPLRVEEIERALRRVELELKRDRDAHVGRMVAASVKDFAGRSKRYEQRLIFKWKRRIIFLDLGEVQWFEAEGNYITIHATEGKYWIRMTMGELQGRLDPAQFLRVHRGLIINLAHMKELVLSAAEPRVLMNNNASLPIGPLYQKRLAELVVSGQSPGGTCASDDSLTD